jgi:glycerol-3-phosphate dehydrogenase (NAD(P)+)
VVTGVPCRGIRATLEEVRKFLRPWVPIISLSKGLEVGTHLRMTQVIHDVIPDHPAGALTGPNLAREIMAGFAAASVIAIEDERVARQVQRVFHSGLFRVYTNDDVIGCELGGALKNVIAIASGMGDGLGVGDNTRSAVITRGLAEITHLGVAMGGNARTFAGLAGMGDLIATCVSPQSRNRYVGEQLGKGRTIADITKEMHMVAEGVSTSRVVLELAAKHGVELPIAQEVHGVVHEGPHRAAGLSRAHAADAGRRDGRRLRALALGIPVLLAASAFADDAVRVFYDARDCRNGAIELEVWDRAHRAWQPHPQHARVPVPSCQAEDAGRLWNELRWRCADEGDRSQGWRGIRVFDAEVMSRCGVDARASGASRTAIAVTSPPDGATIRAREPSVELRGRVDVDGVAGSQYDVVLLIDRGAPAAAFDAQIDAARAYVRALTARLGDVRIAVLSYPAGARAVRGASSPSASTPPRSTARCRACPGVPTRRPTRWRRRSPPPTASSPTRAPARARGS